jgi:adenosine deaminase
MRLLSCLSLVFVLVLAGCSSPPAPEDDGAIGDGDGGTGPTDAAVDGSMGPTDAGSDAAVPACTGTAVECAPIWEHDAVARFDAISGDTAQLPAFLRAMPKGGDLHNHLSGAVYAETYLDWARTDGDCINATTFAAVYASSCSTSTRPTPTSGMFYDQIVQAWSMQDFVASAAESGHDHFFATFAKYGAVAGAHRDDTLADVATRAADENEVYVETMFNLGTHVGTLASGLWSGTLTAADLPSFYAMITSDPGFAAALASDRAAVTGATTGLHDALGCSGASPPAACDVEMRFVAQVARTGSNDQVFGQLVSAFEMARTTPDIVAANLSSPEDDSRSIASYDLQMAMLDFLHGQYAGTSPLHVTLHAGELTPAYLPSGSTANTFHIRAAVETGHAERIGHGLDVMSETDSAGLLAEMAAQRVLVEICLSSNAQILEVSGAAHPLALYRSSGVPVALATDDQGVSRSSMAGEYLRAVQDQHVGYLDLKEMARASLEHSFLPGASLWADVSTHAMVADCTPLADPPSAACQAFLDGSERATVQWELEHRYLVFESTQPPAP